jgi:hypothetical protein
VGLLEYLKIKKQSLQYLMLGKKEVGMSVSYSWKNWYLSCHALFSVKVWKEPEQSQQIEWEDHRNKSPILFHLSFATWSTSLSLSSSYVKLVD